MDVTLLNFIYLVFLACLGRVNIVCDLFLPVVFRVCVYGVCVCGHSVCESVCVCICVCVNECACMYVCGWVVCVGCVSRMEL